MGGDPGPEGRGGGSEDTLGTTVMVLSPFWIQTFRSKCDEGGLLSPLKSGCQGGHHAPPAEVPNLRGRASWIPVQNLPLMAPQVPIRNLPQKQKLWPGTQGTRQAAFHPRTSRRFRETWGVCVKRGAGGVEKIERRVPQEAARGFQCMLHGLEGARWVLCDPEKLRLALQRSREKVGAPGILGT